MLVGLYFCVKPFLKRISEFVILRQFPIMIRPVLSFLTPGSRTSSAVTLNKPRWWRYWFTDQRESFVDLGLHQDHANLSSKPDPNYSKGDSTRLKKNLRSGATRVKKNENEIM